MCGVKIVLPTGDPALVVDSVSIEDDRLCVRGRLLGTMQARMYLGPQEVVGVIAVALRGLVPIYLLLLPYFFVKRLLKYIMSLRRQA